MIITSRGQLLLLAHNNTAIKADRCQYSVISQTKPATMHQPHLLYSYDLSLNLRIVQVLDGFLCFGRSCQDDETEAL